METELYVCTLLLTTASVTYFNAQNTYYPNYRESLAKTKYVKLPLG